MKKHITRCIAVTTIILCFCSCRKTDPPQTINYTIKFSPNALSFIYQPVGKYRIYRDSATSELDSVVITKSKLDMVSVPGITSVLPSIPPYSAQTYDVIMAKKNITPNTTWFTAEAKAGLRYPYMSSETATLSLYQHYNSISFILADFEHQSTGTLTKTIEGTTYNNVYVTDYTTNMDISNPNYFSGIYYWVKDIGIVQRTIVTSGGLRKTSYLTRYN